MEGSGVVGGPAVRGIPLAEGICDVVVARGSGKFRAFKVRSTPPPRHTFEWRSAVRGVAFLAVLFVSG